MEERGDDVMAMRYLWFVDYEGYGMGRVPWVWQWCLVLGVFGLFYRWVLFGLGWVGGYDDTVGLGAGQGVGLNWYLRQCNIHALEFVGNGFWNVSVPPSMGR